jgi:hypothetical protein
LAKPIELPTIGWDVVIKKDDDTVDIHDYFMDCGDISNYRLCR